MTEHYPTVGPEEEGDAIREVDEAEEIAPTPDTEGKDGSVEAPPESARTFYGVPDQHREVELSAAEMAALGVDETKPWVGPDPGQFSGDRIHPNRKSDEA